jgi:hypothetical protein
MSPLPLSPALPQLNHKRFARRMPVVRIGTAHERGSLTLALELNVVHALQPVADLFDRQRSFGREVVHLAIVALRVGAGSALVTEAFSYLKDRQLQLSLFPLANLN